jgi:hypothetical protein
VDPRRLEPRSIGRVLDDALALYGANFRQVAIAAGLVVFPGALLFSVAQVFYVRGMTDFVFSIPLLSERATPQVPLEMLAAASAIAGLSMIYAGLRTYFDGAVFCAAPAVMAGERPGWREVVKGGAPVFWRLAGYALLTYGLTTASVYLTLGLGILALPFLLVFVAFGPVMIALEGAGVVDSLKRSVALVRGDFWRCALALTAIWWLTVQIESAMISPLVIRELVVALQQPEAIYHPASTGWKMVEGLVQGAAIAAVLPISQFALLSFYLDLRSRKEGMDLLMRARALAPVAAPAPASAAPGPPPAPASGVAFPSMPGA